MTTEAVRAASRLLAEVAQERGLRVQRLADDLVLCDDGSRRVLFHGLAGDSLSRVAHGLCGNDAWLRFHLARHSLPVIETRLVDLEDAEAVQRAAAELGFPVRLRPADATGRDCTVDDAASLHHAWQDLQAAEPAPKVILDQPLVGQAVTVAVVDGEVVRAAPADAGASESVRDLAVRAMSTLPGAAYGVVRMVAGPSGAVIDTVDVAPTTWTDPDNRAMSELAVAILAHEFSRSVGS